LGLHFGSASTEPITIRYPNIYARVKENLKPVFEGLRELFTETLIGSFFERQEKRESSGQVAPSGVAHHCNA